MKPLNEFKLGFLILILCVMITACDSTNEGLSTQTLEQTESVSEHTPTSFPEPSLAQGVTGMISVWESYTVIEGRDWPPDQGLNITHFSNDEEEKDPFRVTTDANGQFGWIQLRNQIKEGDVFLIEYEDNSMRLPVRLVSAIVDPDQKTVQGFADPETRVTVEFEQPAGEFINLETYSDQEGNFDFDLSVITDWNDAMHFFWISHFYHPNINTSITNQSVLVEKVSGDIDSKFLLRRLYITNLSVSQTGTILMDFDTDGDLDLIMSQFDWPPPQDALPLLVYKNDSQGNFTKAASEDVFDGMTPQFFNLTKWIIADFNGDGLDDLYLAEGGQDHDPFPGGQNRLLIQTNDGKLRDVSDTNLPQQKAFTHYAAAGDIDNDGDMDIYDCNVWSSTKIGPRFLINDGAGIFQEDTTRIPAAITTLQRKFTSSLLVDVELDGDLDLILGGHDNTMASDAVLINDGGGFFSYPGTPSLPPRLGGINVDTVSMSTADFNHDGYPDLLMSVHRDYKYDQNLQLLYNNGDGTFVDETQRLRQDWIEDKKPGVASEPCGWLVSMYVVDPNNDGWNDIIVQGDRCMNSLLFTNNQGENYTITENYNEVVREDSFGTRYLWALIPGDVDGDNDLDLVVLFSAVEQLIVLRK